MRYQAVCFDIDGTLYEPWMMKRNLFLCWLAHPLLMARYSRMRRDFRLAQEGRSFSEALGMTERESLVLLHREGELDCEAQLVSQLRDDPFLRRMCDELQGKVYRPMARAMLRLKARRGVAETLGRLRGLGIRVGVLSDFPIGAKLSTLGLSELVDFRVDCNDVGYLKPDKRCFDKLAECGKMADMDVHTLLYVGDSYRKDFLGAVGAGWDAVLVGTGEDKGPDGVPVFPTWFEFDKWLFATLEE